MSFLDSKEKAAVFVDRPVKGAGFRLGRRLWLGVKQLNQRACRAAAIQSPEALIVRLEANLQILHLKLQKMKDNCKSSATARRTQKHHIFFAEKYLRPSISLRHADRNADS